jgi:hypothetical protein
MSGDRLDHSSLASRVKIKGITTGNMNRKTSKSTRIALSHSLFLSRGCRGGSDN